MKTGKNIGKTLKLNLVHFIGKDNIVFHCIVFPTMLIADGSFILPDNVPAFEFLNLENDKISTSRNWAVWLHEYLRDFEGKQDVLRYVLLSIAPETKDNDFMWKDFQARNNNELVAILGNFVNRTMVLTQKFFNGKVPVVTELNENDKNTISEINYLPKKIANSFHAYRFREALSEMMNMARLGNKYLTDNEPWKVFASDTKRVGTVLNICLQICANLSIIAEPFLPFTAEKIRKMLNLKKYDWTFAGKFNLIDSDTILEKPALLFEKIEDDTINLQITQLLDTKKQNSISQRVVKPHKSEISFDDFSKIDLRTGIILNAEKVAKTKKLLKLTIDTGIDKRTVVSGIAEFFEPEKIIGQKVTILVNLAPRELKGIKSQGMILMTESADGKLHFVNPGENTEAGCEIK